MKANENCLPDTDKIKEHWIRYIGIQLNVA